MAKSIPVSEAMVWQSYQKVVSKGGGAGIDRESIEEFNENLQGNLYKIWNRMASGSYLPPAVRTVLIPKKQGGVRPLGIPTVSDRIAQGVVKDYLEPILEPIFHNSSFGYRPGRSAHDALAQCQSNCKLYEWVVDVDIKGFFDNINHDMLLRLLRHHMKENWVLLYVGRWLKAGVEQDDKSIIERTRGTPQGGVISPLLANLYLHHAFDKWMSAVLPLCPFERYADDIVIHCRSKEDAEKTLELLHERMAVAELTLHPEKTKIVYCKNHKRKGNHDHESFTFLGYSFQPRTKKSWFGEGGTYLSFECAISSQAKTHIRGKLKEALNTRCIALGLEWYAKQLNPRIRGWVNYYTRFNKHEALEVFQYLNELIRRWLRNKYRLASMQSVIDKYDEIVAKNAKMFYHWKLGITF